VNFEKSLFFYPGFMMEVWILAARAVSKVMDHICGGNVEVK
jgi:hypothetical protein